MEVDVGVGVGVKVGVVFGLGDVVGVVVSRLEFVVGVGFLVYLGTKTTGGLRLVFVGVVVLLVETNGLGAVAAGN